MMKLKKFNKHIVLLSAAIISILIYLILSAVSGAVHADIREQSVCREWSADGESYAYLAAYMPQGYGFDTDSAMRYKRQLESSLMAESMSASEGARLYVDAYSGEMKANVTRDKKTASAVITATSDDFFIFHKLPLIYGSYYDPDAYNYDNIVIDENLAWQLFGSSDVCGMTVYMNDVPLVVTGVVGVGGSGEEFESYYGSSPRAYIPYTQMQRIGYESVELNCFELLVPNPVDKFAYNIVSQWFGSDVKLVEISSRFNDLKILENLDGYFLSGDYGNKINYPYWESLQIVAENKAEFIMFFRIAFVIIAAMALFIELVILILSRGKIFAYIKTKFKKAVSKIKLHKKAKKGIEL